MWSRQSVKRPHEDPYSGRYKPKSFFFLPQQESENFNTGLSSYSPQATPYEHITFARRRRPFTFYMVVFERAYFGDRIETQSRCTTRVP